MRQELNACGRLWT